jgi:hypothetical protein
MSSLFTARRVLLFFPSVNFRDKQAANSSAAASQTLTTQDRVVVTSSASSLVLLDLTCDRPTIVFLACDPLLRKPRAKMALNIFRLAGAITDE